MERENDVYEPPALAEVGDFEDVTLAGDWVGRPDGGFPPWYPSY